MQNFDQDARPSDSFRAGFVAIVGLANVGKSTILNALIEEKLSIVTHKAQTTRQRVLGIYNDDEHQAVFLDTPGMLEPRYLLQESMRAEVGHALRDADVIVYVVDAGFQKSIEHARGISLPEGVPAILCLNKIDRVDSSERDELERSLITDDRWVKGIQTVATATAGLDILKTTILSHLPESPPFYPQDELATAPMRFFVAELIRETGLEELSDEVPYSMAVEVDEYREDSEPLYISAWIYIERESQKGIVIGKGGRTIRTIGSRSRHKIEALAGRKVYLDLRVKVLPNWRRNKGKLKLLGYDLS
jgi:GTP-binding protein Era